MRRHPLALSVVPASTAFAQSQNGAIAGVVKDAAGTVLPGVTVEASSPALIEKTRTVVTDGQGTYKIVELRPGTYTVAFALAGFNDREERGDRAFELVHGNDQRRIASRNDRRDDYAFRGQPDRRHPERGSARHHIASSHGCPADRPQLHQPRLDDAGHAGRGDAAERRRVDPETRLMLQTHGSRIAESRLFVDGMSVMSGNGTGGVNFGNYLNNAMAQELVVTTDSMSAEFELSGVTSNFVTREGSNAVHGSFTGRYASTALQGNNLSADLIARGLTSGNRIKKIWDANPSGGGPLIEDRVWMFSSLRHWGTYNYVAGLYNDLDRTALVYTPDLSKPAIQPVWHVSADTRLTFQATPRNKINAYYHYQHTRFRNLFGAFAADGAVGVRAQQE